jgi:hypothetical protein
MDIGEVWIGDAPVLPSETNPEEYKPNYCNFWIDVSHAIL